MDKWMISLKKAVATFVFASTGILIGGALGDVDVWETAGWVGVGALINFAYRWSESTLRAHGEI
jgi:hypothetical protein